MNHLNIIIKEYLEYCNKKEKLNEKTLSAYQFDLGQYTDFSGDSIKRAIEIETLEDYTEKLLQTYKTKTVKRKLASIRALFRYMCYKNIIDSNPFHKLQLHFREERVLPKVIPMHSIEALLSFMYSQREAAKTSHQKIMILRNIAIVELLFATGIRVSELCSLSIHMIDLTAHTIHINGKGNKERIIQIENQDVLAILKEYFTYRNSLNTTTTAFFISRNKTGMSEQAVRKMIHHYTRASCIPQNITPHMFRHSFATYLLNENVDIRYIQEILGHSSINVTQIYTHVSTEKQREILSQSHPRNKLRVDR